MKKSSIGETPSFEEKAGLLLIFAAKERNTYETI